MSCVPARVCSHVILHSTFQEEYKQFKIVIQGSIKFHLGMTIKTVNRGMLKGIINDSGN